MSRAVAAHQDGLGVTGARVGRAEPRAALADLVVLSLVIAAAYAAKRFYASASAEDLRWALAPTTFLVECVTGLQFAAERGVGFVSASRHLVIAPACAGVNFFVIALLSVTFGFMTEMRTALCKGAFAVTSALLAYVAMIVVNAARIASGIALSQRLGFMHSGNDHLHRIEGVVTYLTALFVLHACVRAVVERTAR